MKAIRVYAPEDMRVIDIEKPRIDEEKNVLIKMKAAGICGSDRGILHGTNAAATYPRIIGHEIVGVVEEIGEGVTRVKPGDRVIIDQVTSCGHCYACRKGRPNVCVNLKVKGVHIDGGYRQWVTCNEKDCYLLPDFLEDKDCVMIEPTTIAVQACSRAQLEEIDDLLIIGAGALGTSLIKIAKLYKPHRLIVSDIDNAKLQTSLELGATDVINSRETDLESAVKELTGGYGSTVTVDAACVKGSLLSALKVTGPAGRVITMGFSVSPEEVNNYLITSKELDVRGSRLQNRKFQEVIDMVKDGRNDLRGSVSHTFPLTEAKEAFRFADSGDPSIKKIALMID